MKKQVKDEPLKPTGRERPWTDNELIVSKTDTKGHITYANDVFLRLAMLPEAAALGAPHSIIRHPDMPRCVFKLLWDTIGAGNEIFAYVNNMAQNGDHYWVFAYVTPSYDLDGKLVGYHSVRRKPRPEQVEKIKKIYDVLLAEELKHVSSKDGLAASTALLTNMLKEKGGSYEEFVFSI